MSSYVRDQIMKKLQYDRPYYATNRTVGHIVTDFDSFPYSRWYRGQYEVDVPIVIEREAGYRHVEKNCNITKPEIQREYPKYCFEAACSTVYPCVADGNKKYDVMLNRTCVIKAP